jgi:hypothetical protein
MRTPPPANLPEGGTPAERLDIAFRKVLTVPKEAILEDEQQRKRKRELARDRPPSLARPIKGNGAPSLGHHGGFRKPGR